MASPFLRGLGAIEVSVTYILGQYGYPLVLASAMTLLYRFFEFWLPLAAGVISFISKKDNLILRLLPGIMIFVLGLVNVISSVTPALPERMHILKEWMPEAIPQMSNGLIMIIGLFMLILCVFLLQGSRRAWGVALILSILSTVGHLLKGVDYEEAILALFVVVVLWHTRDFYRLKPHKQLTRISIRVLVYSILALLTFGVMGFMLMDKRHFGVNFDFWNAFKTMLRLFFLFDDDGLAPRTAFAQHFIYAIYTAGGAVLCFIFFSILKPIFSKPFNTEDDKEKAALLLQKYGRSAFDYFKIYPDKLFFFSDKYEGFISFKVYRYYAVALENPVCKDEDAARGLIYAFDSYCLENGLISVYYRIPKASLSMYTELGKRSVPIGDEAVVDLESFSLNSMTMKSTRKNLNQLKAKGFETKVYTAPVDDTILLKLEKVSENWLQVLHEKEMAFTESVFDKEILKNQIIITVEDESGRIYAFLNVIPSDVSNEAAYDMIRKVNDAPNGVMDLLLVRTMLFLKEQGYQTVNLGMAPLSGIKGSSFTERITHFAYEHVKSLSHFKGIRQYKEKFSSRWEQMYLVYSNNYYLPRIPKVLKHLSSGK
ncbi:MAG: phosphatidylglycerol lysyltransferase domain-containing protein, partial [Bacteroidota bacterium]|nr:phosphatidylglycerol lysyltransferase domain-containing protein [Bacteroidota bacterium]